MKTMLKLNLKSGNINLGNINRISHVVRKEDGKYFKDSI